VKSLFRAFQFLKPYSLLIVGAFACMLLTNASSLIVPQFTRMIVDNGIATKDMSIVVFMALAIVAFVVVRAFFSFLQGVWSAQTAQGVAFDMRNQLYARIQALSFSYHDKAQTGQLMTRATSDVDLVQMFVSQGFLMVIGSVLMMIGSIVLLFITNWRLSLVMLVIAPVTFGVFGWVNSKIRPMFMIVQQRLAKLNTVLQESLVGVRVVKAFVREDYEAKRYAAANKELYDINVKIGRYFALSFPMVFTMSGVATASVYWIGGAQVIGSTLTVGELLSFANYVMMAFWPLMGVTMIITMISQASASAQRIYEVLDTQSEVVEKPNAQALPVLRGEVAFENVSFRYFGSGDWVLDDVSFQTEPGQVIALLGATGSGKSTIINLVPRFYDVTQGQVTVDGVDVRDVTLDSLRSQIGIVFQDVTLFAGTIRENIAFGHSDASDEEIIAAAKAAEAHDFIIEFPDGYNTMVGERGVTLSGGQKQRVAIARALVLNPRILILDDSTSSVDLETEYRIQKALDRLMEGRTSFVIAQRIATVLNADQILVLERGKIVAHGVHEELMRDSEIYAHIYSSQLLPDNALAGEEPLAGGASGNVTPATGHIPTDGDHGRQQGMAAQLRGPARSSGPVVPQRKETR
jgi:ATP-binding cassette, subfamily B, multidrug efflux pump